MRLLTQSLRQQHGEQKGGAEVDGGENGRRFEGRSVLQRAEENHVQQYENAQACTAERQRVTAVQGEKEHRCRSKRCDRRFREGGHILVEPEENVVVVEKPDNVAEVTVESLWEDISDNLVIAPEPAVYGPAPTPDNGDDDLIFPDDDLFPDDLNVMYGPPTDCDLMDGNDIMA